MRKRIQRIRKDIKFEYLVTWRRKNGRKKRSISQGITASNDRFDRLVGESDECTCYNQIPPVGDNCHDQALEKEQMCSPCSGDYATEVTLSRRTVGQWGLTRGEAPHDD